VRQGRREGSKVIVKEEIERMKGMMMWQQMGEATHRREARRSRETE
tara:strand:- start:727 stop:864 length:138 start_codon:yes stop_codon:yes gene_type:complete